MRADRPSGKRVVEAPIGGDQWAVPNHRDGDVQAVVHRAREARGKLECQRQQGLRGVHLKREGAERLQGVKRGRHDRLASYHPFPERVGDLHEQEIWNEQVVVRIKQTACRRLQRLRDQPFEGDTGVDDEGAQRSRSSRMRTALLRNRRPRNIRRTRLMAA